MKNYSKLVRYGTAYGGFYYPRKLDDMLSKDSVIYCFGAGEDISHDVLWSGALNAKVYIFDPTIRAIKHVQLVKDCLNKKAPMKTLINPHYGGGDSNYWRYIAASKCRASNLILKSYALGLEDSLQKFYKPMNLEHVSHSLVPGMKSDDFVVVEVKTITTIMKELNHNKIDVLKIDIEGVECEILKQLVNLQIFPTYLSVDFDLGWVDNNLQDRQECFNVINLLKESGYEILHHMGANYTFIKKRI